VGRTHNRRKLGEHYKEELKKAIQEIVDSEKKRTGNVLELSITK